MFSLIQAQEKVLARMCESRTSKRREQRNAGHAVHRYRVAMIKRGYSAAEVSQQCSDLWDMYNLHAACEE